jgi:hypothetical protein
MILKGLKRINSDSYIRRVTTFITIIYFFIYQWSINFLNVIDGNSCFNISILKNWQSLITRRSGLFLYEGIGTIELFNSIQWVISPMNILLGFILSGLVFINIASAIYIYKLPKVCRLDNQLSGLIGILPSFLAGFVCCVPSILIPFASILGSSLAFMTRIFNWIFPLSIIILLYGAFRSLKRISSVKL